MNIQVSYKKTDDTGMLYLVPTPIGNLEDITYRALETLKAVDIIAAEDTRQTLKLCRHFDIQKSLVSYHEHNKHKQEETLLNRLKSGASIALVTDAGTPAISDPGEELVAACIRQEIDVVSLPGPNAAVTGLVASGLPTDHFLFYGFLPRQKADKKQALEKLKSLPYTLIFYEGPHRLKATLTVMSNILGARQAVVAREITKRYETFIRGTIDELIVWCEEEGVKGECSVIVEGASEEDRAEAYNWWENLTIQEHVEHYIKIKNMKSKDAIKAVATDRELPKREVYRVYHVEG